MYTLCKRAILPCRRTGEIRIARCTKLLTHQCHYGAVKTLKANNVPFDATQRGNFAGRLAGNMKEYECGNDKVCTISKGDCTFHYKKLAEITLTINLETFKWYD